MLAIQMLQAQLTGVHNILHDLADDLTDAEWTSHTLPGANLIAFDLWHVARAQDWAVRTMIRGVPEVAAAPRWSGRLGARNAPGLGVGLSTERADALGRALRRQDVVAYADAVHDSLLSWLGSVGERALEAIPDVNAHIAQYPEYQEPALRETAPWLFEGVPAWHFLTRSCIGHALGHLTTVDILKQHLRRDAETRAEA